MDPKAAGIAARSSPPNCFGNSHAPDALPQCSWYARRCARGHCTKQAEGKNAPLAAGYGLAEEDAWSAFLSHPDARSDDDGAIHRRTRGNVDERILLLIEGLPSGERTASLLIALWKHF